MLAISAYQYFSGSVTGATYMTFRTGVTLLIGAVTMPCPEQRRQQPQQQPTTTLRGRILRFEWETEMGCSYKGEVREGPHWQEGGDPRPGVLNVGQEHPVTVKVRIEIEESEGQPGTGLLEGTAGELHFRCTNCPLSAGQHDVTVQVEGLPRRIARIRSAVQWTLTGASPCDLGRSRIHVYTILGPLGSCFKGVVWQEALDFLIDAVGLGGIDNRRQALERITRFCHTGHGLTYHSANHYAYADTGARFCLEAYLCTSDKQANCYDQASAVLVLGHAVGIEVEFCLLNAFGFIRPTSLMGVANCNNPCYTLMGNDPFLSQPEFRTPFGNHACCLFDGMVFDACIGPYTGTMTLVEYLKDAIDLSVPEEYWENPWVDNGKRLGERLLVANTSHAGRGEIFILDRGRLGQAPRRHFSTLIDEKGVRSTIGKAVVAFQKLTGVTNVAGLTPQIEQVLENHYVHELSHLSPEEALKHLQGEVIAIATHYLNDKFGKAADVEKIRHEVETANKKELSEQDNKERESALQQAEARKAYIEMELGTAVDYDNIQIQLGKKIYPYNPETLELL